MRLGNLIRAVAVPESIVGGGSYEAEVWVRTQGVDGAGVTVSLIWLDAVLVDWRTAGHVLGTTVIGGITGTTDWTRFSGEFTAPAGAVEVRFRLSMSSDPDESGAAWFDDATFCGPTGGP